MTVGVLAFQGDFSEHHQILKDLGVQSIDVRNFGDLSKVSALIIPGGESTVIAKFLEETGVGREIIRRSAISERSAESKAERAGKAERQKILNGSGMLPAVDSQSLSVFGTCAGAIVLAKKATGKNAPKTLGLIDVTIDRNAYGSQVDSFEASLKIKGLKEPVDVAFIRAPKIVKVGKDVDVLATYKGNPVLVRQGNVMIATFHPEVRNQNNIHRLFLSSLKVS